MKEKGPIRLNEMGEELQLETLRQDASSIKFIDNPSLKLQLEAVKYDGYAIQYIKNPSKEVQLEAIKEYEHSIEYIDNPLLEVQLEAVRMDGYTIRHICNPSEQVQLEALRENGRSIKYIDNPFNYIKSIISIIETTHRKVYVLHEPDKEPLFSIGCQKNISKDYFIWRIYNLDGGLEENPHRQEYLDIINRY